MSMINIKMTHQNSSSDASKTALFLCVPFFRLIRAVYIRFKKPSLEMKGKHIKDMTQQVINHSIFGKVKTYYFQGILKMSCSTIY